MAVSLGRAIHVALCCLLPAPCRGLALRAASEAAEGSLRVPNVLPQAAKSIAGNLAVGSIAAQLAAQMAAGMAAPMVLGPPMVASGALAALTAPLTMPVAAVGMPVAATAMTAAAAGVGTVGVKAAQVVVDASDQDLGVEMEELVWRRGYAVERHRVRTADGYILGVFRIPRGRDEAPGPGPKPGGRKPAVLLQHGLWDSSLAFVANFPGQSLAYVLADAGYDVWLGNNRGNKYSRMHAELSPLSTAFWNFTWAEMAEYDLPAEIEYILNATGAARLAYVGHSEGSTQAFAALSSNNTLASKVSVLVALSPTAYVKRQKVVLLNAIQYLGLHKLAQLFGDRLFSLSTSTMNVILPLGCRVMNSGCNSLMEMFSGRSKHMNHSRIHVYSEMFPAGTSTKNMGHWIQSIRSGTFAKFDYGVQANLKHYGTRAPPAFDLSRLSVPTAMFSGGQDAMADPEDVRRLYRELRPGVVFKFKEVPTYAHLDPILALDANTLIYPEVLEAIASHGP